MRALFDTLTLPQLAALSPEDIDHYIDLTCAEQGVPLLPEHPGERPTLDVACDATVYELPSLIFLDVAEATRLLEAAQSCVSLVEITYMPGPGYKKQVRERSVLSSLKLSTEQVYSARVAGTMKTRILAAEQAKSDYDKALTDYEDARIKREAVAVVILDRISEARVRRDRQERLTREYKRYLELAEGRRSVAANFLRSAHADAPELLPDLFAPEEFPGIGAPRAYAKDEIEF